MKKTIVFLLWAVCFTLVFNMGLDLLNESSTVANIIGLLVAGAAVSYSVQTGCFYTFKKREKDEEDNQED